MAKKSKRQKAKAKAQRQQIRSEAKSSGKSVSRADVQSARQAQKSSAPAASTTATNTSGGSSQARPNATREKRQARREEQRPLIQQQVDNASDYQFDQYRKKSVNSAELSNLRKQGFTYGEIMNAANESGLKIGKAAQNRFDRWTERGKAKERAQTVIATPEVEEVAETQPTQPTTPPSTPQVQPPETSVTPQPPQTTFEPPNVQVPGVQNPGEGSVNPTQDNDMIQQVSQDNDITTSIDGSNNYVNNQQDNSIRQYGGDNRQFTYVGGQNGGNPALDTPASAATMAGYWDVNDSPAKQASFVDMYSTINRDAQKQYSNVGHITQGAINRANMNSTINTNALDKRIYDREQYSRAKSDMMGMNLFGDMYKGTAPTWQRPEPQKEVETPDFDKLYDTMTDF